MKEAGAKLSAPARSSRRVWFAASVTDQRALADVAAAAANRDRLRELQQRLAAANDDLARQAAAVAEQSERLAAARATERGRAAEAARLTERLEVEREAVALRAADHAEAVRQLEETRLDTEQAGSRVRGLVAGIEIADH